MGAVANYDKDPGNKTSSRNVTPREQGPEPPWGLRRFRLIQRHKEHEFRAGGGCALRVVAIQTRDELSAGFPACVANVFTMDEEKNEETCDDKFALGGVMVRPVRWYQAIQNPGYYCKRPASVIIFQGKV